MPAVQVRVKWTNGHPASQGIESHTVLIDGGSPLLPRPTSLWLFQNKRYKLGRIPLLMGIVNVTPDSFSDGGSFLDTENAISHAMQLIEDGADILDIGGESTRPGSEPVSVDDELRRVLPVVEGLAARNCPVPISIDTTKAEIARRALEAGAAIINDISGLRFDRKMPAICAQFEAGVICMHMQGTPATMQQSPQYNNVVAEISAFLEERLAALELEGIPRARVVLDPGVGFGKTAAHNLEILSRIDRFRALGRPVLIGHSRKRFIGKILGREVEERNAGTIGVSVALAAQSVDIVRVHDVRATRDALLAWRTILEKVEEGCQKTE